MTVVDAMTKMKHMYTKNVSDKMSLSNTLLCGEFGEALKIYSNETFLREWRRRTGVRYFIRLLIGSQ